MGFIARTWKDFIKHSLGVFSSEKPEDDLVLSRAFKLFFARVVKDKLTLSSAAELVSDQQVISDLIEIARDDVKKQESNSELKDIQSKVSKIADAMPTVLDGLSSVADDTQATAKGVLAVDDKIAALLVENASLQLKLDAARKRAIRYFRTGLTISASSIALSVAMRYGAVDFVKDRVVDMFYHKQSAPAQTGKPSSQQNAASSVTPSGVQSDAVILKMGTNGLRGPNGERLCDAVRAGREVVLPAANGSVSVCLRPDRPLVVRPQAAAAQSQP